MKISVAEQSSTALPVAVDGELCGGEVDADRVVVPLVVAHLGQLPPPFRRSEGRENVNTFESLEECTEALT